MTLSVAEIVRQAQQIDLAVPAFNIPYLPMMEPVIQSLIDEDVFGLVAVARLEWTKFEAGGPAAVAEEYAKWQDPEYVRLHLDHVPVIDEDNLRVNFLEIIREAIDLGYNSIMIDGSRLDLNANINATRQATELAHAAGIPCEAELGAVLGHESGPLPPYDELFESGRGFTDVVEAERFVQETQCDWLSVAVGSVHGAISGVQKDQKKVAARLNIEHLRQLAAVTRIPLVLHGGSGVQHPYLLQAIKNGMTKINIGTEIRQAYEQVWRNTGNVSDAQQACYERTSWLLRDYFGLSGTRLSILRAVSQTDRTNKLV